MTDCLRAAAGVALGVLIFAGLLYLLVPVNILERLVTADVYHDAINDADAYNRVYNNALVDEALRNGVADFLGDIEIDSTDDAVALLREVFPPAYLQEQTENNVDRMTAYIRGETDDLDIYIELGAPLSRVEPAARAWVYGVISGLDITEPATSACSADAILQMALAAAEPVAGLSNGELPQSAPSLSLLTRECREQRFDEWFDSLLSIPSIPPRASVLLGETREEIRGPFYEGDTRAFLKAAASPLIGPLIDDAIAEVRRELQPNDRLDLIARVSKSSTDPTREEIEDNAALVRVAVNAARGPGKYAALLIVALGCLLLAAVHVSEPRSMLRWPGIALLCGGAVSLVAGYMLHSIVPGQLREAVTNPEVYASDVPISAINLAGDLAESLARHATAGFAPWAVAAILIGAALIAVSVFLNPLIQLARKIAPIGR